MANLVWYNGLAALGIGLAVLTVSRKRRLAGLATWPAFYLFATGITWLGEFTVLGLFGSYAYKPGVYADPWAENLLGHLILNSTLWPGTAVMVAGYSLGLGWQLAISGVYVLIEYLFVKSGLYEQHWWRYYLTAGTVLLFLAIAKGWFALMIRRQYAWVRFVTLYFAAFVIIHLPSPLLLLAGMQYYDAGLADNLVLSSTLLIFVYQLAETLAVVSFIVQDRWYWKLVPFVVAAAGQYWLAGRGILVFQGGWNLSLSLAVYFLCLAACVLLERLALRPRTPGRRRWPGT